MKNAKVGDVIHFTKLRTKITYKENEAPYAPAWGVVVEVHGGCEFMVEMIRFTNKPNMDEPYRGWAVSLNPTEMAEWGDEFTIIPVEKWPDEVCAMIAQWRLSQ